MLSIIYLERRAIEANRKTFILNKETHQTLIHDGFQRCMVLRASCSVIFNSSLRGKTILRAFAVLLRRKLVAIDLTSGSFCSAYPLAIVVPGVLFATPCSFSRLGNKYSLHVPAG